MGAGTHGMKGYFGVEDSGGTTVRNISPYVKSTSFEQDNDTHDNTTYGATGHTFQVGLTNGKITIQGLWDTTALVGTNTVIDGLIGLLTTTLTFEYGPAGNTTGKVKKTGECVLESYVESVPVDDLITFTATFQISGTVTKTVF